MAEQTKAELVKALGETTWELVEKRGELAKAEKRFNGLVDELGNIVEQLSQIGRGNVMYRTEAVNLINAALMAAGVRRT